VRLEREEVSHGARLNGRQKLHVVDGHAVATARTRLEGIALGDRQIQNLEHAQRGVDLLNLSIEDDAREGHALVEVAADFHG
jgi:hypothetical protein